MAPRPSWSMTAIAPDLPGSMPPLHALALALDLERDPLVDLVGAEGLPHLFDHNNNVGNFI